MKAEPVDPNAFALRVVRVDAHNNRFINYEGMTFPRDPQSGCSLIVRRMAAFGFIVKDSDLILDVLDEEGDIIQDYSISKLGFEYLRRQLKFKRERELQYIARTSREPTVQAKPEHVPCENDRK